MTVATHRILVGDVLDKLADLPERSVHCCVTSPPYWNLRDYKVDGQIGLEPTIDEYVAKMVEVFAAVRRVLRDDATLFVNMGDSYNANQGSGFDTHQDGGERKRINATSKSPKQAGLAPGNLCNIPARFSLAMQDDGWILRSTIIWAKGLSFCDEYAGSVMPESVNGWRWERCRVKVASGKGAGEGHPSNHPGGLTRTASPGGTGNMYRDFVAEWSDCPGCDKCKPNGGLVLRKGSWRPTSAYEFVFMFAKTADYYADGDAVREALGDWSKKAMVSDWSRKTMNGPRGDGTINVGGGYGEAINPAGRNLRNVWVSPPDGTPLATDVLVVNPQAFAKAHFATFPEKLVEPIIKAATSDKGVCPECGGPWARVIENAVSGNRKVCPKDENPDRRDSPSTSDTSRLHNQYFDYESRTLGWRPTCGCEGMATSWPLIEGTPCMTPIPATVLDPFVGSGTTLLVANQHGRDAIGIELSPKYALMAEDRIGKGLRPLSYRPQCNDNEYAPLFTETAG